jgi:hypothetical protein
MTKDQLRQQIWQTWRDFRIPIKPADELQVHQRVRVQILQQTCWPINAQVKRLYQLPLRLQVELTVEDKP